MINPESTNSTEMIVNQRLSSFIDKLKVQQDLDEKLSESYVAFMNKVLKSDLLKESESFSDGEVDSRVLLPIKLTDEIAVSAMIDVGEEYEEIFGTEEWLKHAKRVQLEYHIYDDPSNMFEDNDPDSMYTVNLSPNGGMILVTDLQGNRLGSEDLMPVIDTLNTINSASEIDIL